MSVRSGRLSCVEEQIRAFWPLIGGTHDQRVTSGVRKGEEGAPALNGHTDTLNIHRYLNLVLSMDIVLIYGHSATGIEYAMLNFIKFSET